MKVWLVFLLWGHLWTTPMPYAKHDECEAAGKHAMQLTHREHPQMIAAYACIEVK